MMKWTGALLLLILVGGCAPKQPPLPGAKYCVYLTSDDGPLRSSGAINEVIAAEGVPMEAFVIGKHARPKLFRSYLEAYRANPYVTLGDHSYTHANGHYLSYYAHPDKVLEEFERTKRELNLPEKVGRLPGRDSWRIGGGLTTRTRARRQRPISWPPTAGSSMAGIWSGPTPAAGSPSARRRPSTGRSGPSWKGDIPSPGAIWCC